MDLSKSDGDTVDVPESQTMETPSPGETSSSDNGHTDSSDWVAGIHWGKYPGPRRN